MTKLMWIKEHQPDLYAKADKFIHWSGWIAFMLGAGTVAEASDDYSLANRSLLFDIDRHSWSDDILCLAQIDAQKLPMLAPSGTPIGVVSKSLAKELGLNENTLIISGAQTW
jgi:sugar (pentulose or hexulose) kinase